MATTTVHEPSHKRFEGTRSHESVPQAPMATDTDEKPAKAKKAKSKRTFTKAEIVKAMKQWAKDHGRQPSSAAWWPARQLQYAEGAKTVAERKEYEKAAKDHVAAGLPTTPQVVSVFGSWSAAIQAAGFEKPAKK